MCIKECPNHGETSYLHETSHVVELKPEIYDGKSCCGDSTLLREMIVGGPLIFFMILKNFEEIQTFCNQMNKKYPMLQIAETFCVGLSPKATVTFGADLRNNPRIVSSIRDNLGSHSAQASAIKDDPVLVSFKTRNEFLSQDVKDIHFNATNIKDIDEVDYTMLEGIKDQFPDLLRSKHKDLLLYLLGLLLCNKDELAMHYHIEDLSHSDVKSTMYDTSDDSMGHIQFTDSAKKIMYIMPINDNEHCQVTIAILDLDNNHINGIGCFGKYPDFCRLKVEKYFMLNYHKYPTFNYKTYVWDELQDDFHLLSLVSESIFAPGAKDMNEFLKNMKPLAKKILLTMEELNRPSSSKQQTAKRGVDISLIEDANDESSEEGDNDICASMLSLSTRIEDEKCGDETNTNCGKRRLANAQASKMIIGKTHQAAIKYGVVGGVQCTCVATVALLQAMEDETMLDLTPDCIDSIIKVGSNIHLETVIAAGVKQNERIEALSIDELPALIRGLDDNEYVVQYVASMDYCGALSSTEEDEEHLYRQFKEKLEKTFSDSKTVLLVAGTYTYGLNKEKEGISMFDSHSKDYMGRRTASGFAQVRLYSDERTLFNHLLFNREGRHLASYNLIPVVFFEKNENAVGTIEVAMRSDVVIEGDETITLKKGEKLRLVTPQNTSSLFLLGKNEKGAAVIFRGVYALAPQVSSEDHCRRKAERKKRSKKVIEINVASEETATETSFVISKDVRWLRDSPLPPDPLFLDFNMEQNGTLCQDCSKSLGVDLNNICDVCLVKAVETHLPSIDAIVQGNLKSFYDEYIGNLVFKRKRASWLNLKKEKDQEKRLKMMQSIKRRSQSNFFRHETYKEISNLDIPGMKQVGFYSISAEESIRFRLTKELQSHYKAEKEQTYTSASINFVTFTEKESMSYLYFFSVLALEVILRIVYDFLSITDRSNLDNQRTWLKKVKQYSLNKYWKLKANDEHEVLEHATPNEELDEGTSTNQEEKSEPDQNVEITQSKPVKKDTEGETFDKSFDLRKHVISKKKCAEARFCGDLEDSHHGEDQQAFGLVGDEVRQPCKAKRNTQKTSSLKNKISSQIIEQQINCNDFCNDLKENSEVMMEREKLCITVLENYRNDATSVASAILLPTGRQQGQVTYSDLFKLLPTEHTDSNGWISGDTISAFHGMIMNRSMSYQTLPKTFILPSYYTRPKKKPNKLEMDIKDSCKWLNDPLEYDLIMAPLSNGSHWFLYVADCKRKRFMSYDSGIDRTSHESGLAIFKKVLLGHFNERKENIAQWDIIKHDQSPKQENGSDCGIFLLCAMKQLSIDADCSYQQSDMADYRKMFLYSLFEEHLPGKMRWFDLRLQPDFNFCVLQWICLHI